MNKDYHLSSYLILTVLSLNYAIEPPEEFRTKRQSPLSRAWEEALPGVQPFWDKYSTGPYGVVIRGWQFSRCASEQVLFCYTIYTNVPY